MAAKPSPSLSQQEKQATAGLTGATLGALLGMATSERGDRARAVGRGAVLGGGTELGGIAGFVPGSLIGGLAGYGLGGSRGAGLGAVLGGGTGAIGGGVLGNMAAQGLLDDDNQKTKRQEAKEKNMRKEKTAAQEFGEKFAAPPATPPEMGGRLNYLQGEYGKSGAAREFGEKVAGWPGTGVKAPRADKSEYSGSAKFVGNSTAPNYPMRRAALGAISPAAMSAISVGSAGRSAVQKYLNKNNTTVNGVLFGKNPVASGTESTLTLPPKTDHGLVGKLFGKSGAAREFGAKLAFELPKLDLNNPMAQGGLGGAALGAGMGGLAGALNPGEETTLDEDGRLVKRRKSRLAAALGGALGGGVLGGGAGAALGHFRPDIVDQGMQLLGNKKTAAPPPTPQ